MSLTLHVSAFHCFDALNLVSVFLSLPFPIFLDFSLSVSALSFQVCVCVCVSFHCGQTFPLRTWVRGWYLGLRGPTRSERTRGQKIAPQPLKPPHHTYLLGSCCDSAKGRERGRHQGKKEGENGTMKEGQEIKDQGSREEEKAPAAPANRFSAMPALPSVF